MASGRTFNSTRDFASTRGTTRGTTRSTPSVAFGGRATNNSNSHGTYAFASHQGWNHNQEYNWNGHHYRWYNNGWFIIDPFPYAGYGYYGPNYYGPAYYYSGSVTIEVQHQLAQDGYYLGPIDGIVGPGTRAAIAAFQQANGLRVTGNINPALLNTLGMG